MPISATPGTGLSDHIEDVGSHTGRFIGEQTVTSRSLRAPADPVPNGVRPMHVARTVLHHDETNESWGSGG